MQGAGFRVQGLPPAAVLDDVRVEKRARGIRPALGFRFEGLGCGVEGLGFRV